MLRARGCLRDERARAALLARQDKGNLSAVMGQALCERLSESSEWNAKRSLETDPVFYATVTRLATTADGVFSRLSVDSVVNAAAAHLRWALHDARDCLLSDLSDANPDTDATSLHSAGTGNVSSGGASDVSGVMSGRESVGSHGQSSVARSDAQASEHNFVDRIGPKMKVLRSNWGLRGCLKNGVLACISLSVL